MKSVCMISCGLEFIKNVLTILTEFTHLLGREAVHTIVVGAQGDSGQRMWPPPSRQRRPFIHLLLQHLCQCHDRVEKNPRVGQAHANLPLSTS